ncbi:hypothetical protein Peur_021466 [Populus x canadensis]
MFCCRNAGTPAARLPRPATSGWPLQRLASPTRGAGQNAGGQGPKAAPPRAREQASRGCRLPRPATSGWPLQRLASPTRGAGQNAGGQGPKAAPPRAREQASRGCRLPRPATSGWPLQRLASPPQGAGQNAGGQGPKAAPPRAREQASRGCPRVARRGMAAGAARARPSAQGPPRALGPQAPAPQRPARAGARARVVFEGRRPGGPRGSFTARAWPTARASGAKRPLLQVGNRTAGARVASSPDSDLEAFSHNPTHGSFAPLAFQPSAMTNCANQRFLSY